MKIHLRIVLALAGILCAALPASAQRTISGNVKDTDGYEVIGAGVFQEGTNNGTVTDLDGNFVLRMLYIHPDTFPEGLIELAAERKKILPYFDIPFQHADEKVLRLMKRTGNREKYLALLERIRKATSNP